MTADRDPRTVWHGHTVDALRVAWDVPTLEVWDTLTSTNDRAAELAQGGAGAWTVVVAGEQTAGRGRRGRPWRSSAGEGLWMSVLVDPAPTEGAFPLPLVVGTVVAEVLDASVEGLRCAVKWPNDILASGRKLGGVLCEARSGAAVVGIGINIGTPTLDDRPTDDDVAEPLEPVGLRALSPGTGFPALPELCGAVVTRLRAALEGAGPVGDVRERFRARDVLDGRTVRSETAGVGVARGVADDGSLLLERADGTRVHVVSGSVRRVSGRG